MAAPGESFLDANQCIVGAYDDVKKRLRVDAELTATIIPPPGLEVSISSTDDNIAIRNSDNTDELEINPDGSINVQTVQIFTKPFDAITATYPSGTQEVYQSRVGGTSGTVQETVTVNYTDSSKASLLNVART